MEFVFTSTVRTTNFFDEGPQPRGRAGHSTTYANTGSIDISATDTWTQGVELTSQRRYDAGVVKIWSGEPAHSMLKQWFGMDRNYGLEQPHKDIDLFDPVLYVESQMSASVSGSGFSNVPLYTFPIVTGDSDQYENFQTDGIIEPLTIRSRVAFFSIETPFESHEIKGTLQSGNSNILLGSDVVTTIRQFEPEKPFIPFLDMVDSIAGIQLPGFFITDQTVMAPFIDVDSDFTNDLEPGFRPSEDSYVTYYEEAATAGFVYEFNGVKNVDSIAFGGMIY